MILLDLHMRRLNGWQACRRLKAAMETSNIPVVALTGDATEQAKREAIEAGCDRFIVKGSDRESLIEAIREVLPGGT